jgi:ribose 5-phosphate isomerase A
VSDALAAAAVAPITAGMVVGLGTGRAASRAIAALAARATGEGLAVSCVATSERSHTEASGLGLVVRPMAEVERVDYHVDGADEFDGALGLLKGRGGAMTREKIVARAAGHRVYLVQATKEVAHLTGPVPAEVLGFGLASIRRALRELGMASVVRPGVTSDDGNPILDITPAPHFDPRRVAAALDAITGVVSHGLFLDEADAILIEDAGGQVTRRDRVR